MTPNNQKKSGIIWLVKPVFLLSLIIVATALFLVDDSPSSNEPSYNGITASEWVARICKNTEDKESQEALKSLGPNAAPALIQALRISDTFAKRAVSKVYWNTPEGIRNVVPFMDSNSIQHAAYDSLKLITHGPRPFPEIKSKEILTILIEALSCEDNRNIYGWHVRDNDGNVQALQVGQEVRLFAINVLGLIGTQANQALPKLKELANDKNEKIAASSAIAVERIELGTNSKK